MVALLGANDENIGAVRMRDFRRWDVLVRGNEIHLSGEVTEIGLAEQVLAEMLVDPAPDKALRRTSSVCHSCAVTAPVAIAIVDCKHPVHARQGDPSEDLNQKRYVDAIDQNTIVFGIIRPVPARPPRCGQGRAGASPSRSTGSSPPGPQRWGRERLVCPARVLSEKIDPYLRPLYDALHDMIDPDRILQLMTSGTIEVAPLAYMRGRTLNDAFIIPDEAQNTTAEKMKMFLTRPASVPRWSSPAMSRRSICPVVRPVAWRIVQKILADIDDVAFYELTSDVRHKLVGIIVDAYGRYE